MLPFPFRSTLAVTLCAALLDTSVPAQAAPAKAALPASHRNRTAPLTQRERTLHALNRFTFGPRPGDVAAVSRIGLDRWFEQQLNPQSVGDSVLETRLDVFPAMRLSQPQLVSRFPSNQLIRIAARGDLPIPTDPTTHAIYTDSIAFYNEGQARKVAAQPSEAAPVAAPPAPAAQPKRGPRPDLLGPESLYTVAYGPKKPAAAAIAQITNTIADATPRLRPRRPAAQRDLLPGGLRRCHPFPATRTARPAPPPALPLRPGRLSSVPLRRRAPPAIGRPLSRAGRNPRRPAEPRTRRHR